MPGHYEDPNFTKSNPEYKKRYKKAMKSRTAPDSGPGQIGKKLYNLFSGNKKEINSPNQ